MATTIGFMTTAVWKTDDVSGYPGAVRKVHWTMRWSNPELYGDFTVDTQGDTVFDLSAEALPASENYVAIADVTDAIIKTWVMALMANYDEFVAHHEEMLAGRYSEYTLIEHSNADPYTDPNFV